MNSLAFPLRNKLSAGDRSFHEIIISLNRVSNTDHVDTSQGYQLDECLAYAPNELPKGTHLSDWLI